MENNFWKTYLLKIFFIKQVKQVIHMYTNLTSQCFTDCVNDFTSDTLSSKEVKNLIINLIMTHFTTI
jgi:hypothetical protein